MDDSVLEISVRFLDGKAPLLISLPLGSTINDMLLVVEQVHGIAWQDQVILFQNWWFYPHPGDDLGYLIEKIRGGDIRVYTRYQIEDRPDIWDNQVRDIDHLVRRRRS
jgi:hypothetical protein